MQQLAKRPTRSFAVMMLAAAWALSGSAVSAQTPPSSPSPAAPNAAKPTPDISDQKLDAAATAVKEVANVKESYQQKIESAAAPDKAQVLQEANTALVKAVTDQGLSLEEYNSILTVAQNDPVVREKILQRIRPPAQ